jgi:hypothetical protein
MVESSAQSGRQRTLIYPGPISGVNVSPLGALACRWLEVAGRVPLLTPTEELHLGEIVLDCST